MKIAFVCAAALLIGSAVAAHAQPDAWSAVWKALQSAPAPAAAAQDGPPVREGDRVLFRFRAPAAAKVYLAGSFNAWARNNRGNVTDQRFAMRPAGNGIWYRWVELEPRVHQYRYVVEDSNGSFQWLPDPHVEEADKDGNTVLDVSRLPRRDSRKPLPGRTPKPFQLPSRRFPGALEVRSQRVWVRPDQTNSLLVRLPQAASPPGARLDLSIRTPLGESVHKTSQRSKGGENRLPVPALRREGGYLARVTLSRAGRTLAQGETVLSVVRNVADDLRYGFYATYNKPGKNYDAKADLFARFHVNAVEFYDYFPAHGYYAPRVAEYKFEPFGIPLDARDVRQKIRGGRRRGILSLAYVAAYAASESVYRRYPDPMTDENGVPKVFNGQVMTEAEADQQNKPKWFWLMNVSAGSLWHRYILGELARTLDDGPADLVSFDGFELDTYGHGPNEKFYAGNSRRSGDLLSDVLHDFVGDVQALTHKIKPHGLVSFNSVNEFGVEKIYDVTDFLFLEIWSGHTEDLGELVDICFRHRAPRGQRVVLKLYPADMRPGQKSWPPDTLRRVLAAVMTGAGSLMVVGEPDAEGGKMHALNTLFYPDHQPLPAASEQLLRDYYRFDALMYGWTHGKDVVNTDLYNPVPGCITRTYAAPRQKALVVQLLNVENERKWTADTPAAPPRRNREITLDLPGGITPSAVWFASPDVPALQTPVRLDFDVAGGRLRTLLPELRVHGTLILQYGGARSGIPLP